MTDITSIVESFIDKDYSGLMPHGFCLLAEPWVIVGFMLTHAIIAFSYFGISYQLWAFMHKRNTIRSDHKLDIVVNIDKSPLILTLFAAFIVLCGATHVFSILMIFKSMYFEALFVLTVTAVVSLATFFVIYKWRKS